MSGTNVPKTFRPEAVNWVVYLLNRCPTFEVKDATLEEALSEEKPSVRHLRSFGCLAHVHIPNVQRKKFDDKSMKCLLRVVVFSESKAWNWENASEDNGDSLIECNDDEEEVADVTVEVPAELNRNEENVTEIEPTNNVIAVTPGTNQGRRNRHAPAWLVEYYTNEDAKMLSLAVFTPAEDPSRSWQTRSVEAGNEH